MQELSSLEHQGEVTNSHTHLYTRPNQQETLSHSTENVASQPLCGAMDACPASGLHGQLVVDLPISNSSNLTSIKPTKKALKAGINIGRRVTLVSPMLILGDAIVPCKKKKKKRRKGNETNDLVQRKIVFTISCNCQVRCTFQ